MSREQQNACSTKLVRKYTDKKGGRRCVCLKDELRNSQRLGFTSAILPGSRIFPFPYKCGHAKIWEGDVEVEYILKYPELHHFCGNVWERMGQPPSRHYPRPFGEFMAAQAIACCTVPWLFVVNCLYLKPSIHLTPKKLILIRVC